MGLLQKLLHPRTDKQLQGQAGEDAALEFLEQKGLSLVMRNFRCKAGEIDLIMQEGSTLVFIEVRKRADARFGGAAASVTHAKQTRLLKTAQYYLQRYTMPPACRFDVIAIESDHIDWIKNAITA
jgi:putative endonuclease